MIIKRLIKQRHSHRIPPWKLVISSNVFDSWVGEGHSVNWWIQLYRFSSYWLMQSILSILSIVLIVSIQELIITMRYNWRIIKTTQKTLGWTFGVKEGNFLRLLAFTAICIKFTRSVWEINKILFGLMTSNSPQGKSFTLQNHCGSNISPS